MRRVIANTSIQLVAGLALVFALALGGCSEDEGLKIKSISPKSGPAQGQGAVTITGSGFSPTKGATVYFGEKKGRVIRFDGTTKLVVAPPPGDPGTEVDVLVIFGDAKEHTFPKGYKYLAEGETGLGGVDALSGAKKDE